MGKPTYEELEAQVKQLAAERDAVVAENAALKSAHPQPFGPEMMRALEAYEWHQDDVPETGMLNAFFILRDSITLNTGVTDSVIAKIRAESMADGAFGALKLMGGFTSDECGDSVYLTVKGYAEQLSNSAHNPGAFLASLRAEGVEALPRIQERDIKALLRFNETCEDGEGYDIGEEAMNRLVEIGLCRRGARRVCHITPFGQWVIDAQEGEIDLTPLRTESDVNADFSAHIDKLRSQSEQVKGVQS